MQGSAGEQQLVLVTGATGYIAGEIIFQLLENGYRVRGTVRSLQNTKKIEKLIAIHPRSTDSMELVEAELQDDASIKRAIEGVDYVFHVASPVAIEQPKDPNAWVGPAREGSLSVIRHAAN